MNEYQSIFHVPWNNSLFKNCLLLPESDTLALIVRLARFCK